ncbi:MAG: restriction endonuclease [Gammaproteobacteria bacterium]|nr:restriction endonuclease [Gammaproteobacteria bacterium]
MVSVLKASGERVPFEEQKLRLSLLRVGAYEALANKIVEEVVRVLYDGMSTREIYRIAFRLLRQKSRALSAKYHLKRAIMRLGITGYPFEKYVAEIFRHKGYQSKNNQIIKGHCVNHEVDVVSNNKNKYIFIECKYHNFQGKKCELKIPLYVKSRFLDIAQEQKSILSENLEMWLVTNTRFTSDATQYGRCAGLHLMAWDYPAGNGLKEHVETSGLYPITCITQLTKSELAILFEKNIVLCQSILDDPSVLEKMRFSSERKASVVEQCRALLNDS